MGDVICGSDRSFFLRRLVIAGAASLGTAARWVREEPPKDGEVRGLTGQP